ncbi:phosphoenolpyruvate--protein phosphotransferase [Ahrensia sp. R2A130]|uniref:phosphoenolpyruvate--protein phosphotransferase n=1 Tax=Ahrensia sp. R2A130 TaxID=744979 RepID=UPI0001E0D89E|nr:phosphoenolpyruvate--protein phosphotransferase [Ahrensia sp. R2A130]EFL87947.1 phosphoenolpyruvate-protein phosphotransferase [Ahrensia sp. R2A130]
MLVEKTGPRVLLKSLREAMAEQLGPQERLDRITQQIAAAMAAQVCSVYVRRADDVLELFGTFGLNAEAVHRSQLRVGQGLVGTIAGSGRALNLSDAQSHPAFAYLPETGEDPFQSFLGVPMKRAGRPLGVLTVQNTESRNYSEEDVEALETAAMVLCDLVVSGGFKNLANEGAQLDQSRPISTTGTGLAEGIARGTVVLHEPRVVVENLFGDDAEQETHRLAQAISSLRASVDAMVERTSANDKDDTNHDHIDVLESYRMFAHDRGWVRRIESAIQDGLTAEAAVEKVSQENRSRLQGSPNPYLRERLTDFDDLARRLMKQLMGRAAAEGVEEPFIVVARSMGAAELLDYDNGHLRGLVIEEATATSHVVIVARALGIPVVGQVEGFVSRAENGDAIIADGDEGIAHLRPADDVVASYDERMEFRVARAARFDALRGQPSETRDGVPINLMLNAGLTMDLQQLETSGAAGIGLFRTELQFMIASKLPRLDEQTRFYRTIMDAAGDKPVTFRTLDIGGDKVLPYLRTVKEDNPALGWRAIRLAIDRPGLLRVQLRALIKAAAGRRLKIKIPMVTMVTEIDQVRVILDREMEAQARFGHDLPASVELGCMIEVPSLLFQLDEVMERVDFVSVGSNDLFQFMAASDRTNSYLANRFNPLSRPFLRALREIVRAADRHDTPLQLCGELAGDPLSVLALIGIGYRTISMPPAAIGPVKELVRAMDCAHVCAHVGAMVDETIGTRTVPEVLRDFADENGLPV